ncbi:shikimate dehydrogenase [Leifsonia sp. Root112D2]|uniref:shikimate dehydrogenase n=1 Tax=Leifsonia sp. Root112D2 TaxID=1736426 RepID=UPI0006FBA1B8|nr:shikimate dehydrogenase [Leifsonia sp. Root112D2]KQV06790.1 shikimate dehydrogenase [Leifsonia sp. Root112D2]
MDAENASVPSTAYLVGLIGEGIGPSLSPPLHESEAHELGLDYEYRLLDLLELNEPAESVGRLLHEARDEGFSALNITHPCKQLVMQYLDEVDVDAERLGAVNLVLIRDGRFIGYNTDWVGFRDGVLDGLPDAALENVVQFGGGGAGSASAYAMLALGTQQLTLTDLVPERVEGLAQRLRELFPDREVLVNGPDEVAGTLARADGVINATPLGMTNHPGVAFDVARLRADAWVADVVYFPIETQVLLNARAHGLRTLDGGRMNVGQAVAGMRLITGIEPDAARMRAHFLELIAERELAQ